MVPVGPCQGKDVLEWLSLEWRRGGLLHGCLSPSRWSCRSRVTTVAGPGSSATSNVTFARAPRAGSVGGELDYMDDGTLSAALKARRPL